MLGTRKKKNTQSDDKNGRTYCYPPIRSDCYRRPFKVILPQSDVGIKRCSYRTVFPTAVPLRGFTSRVYEEQVQHAPVGVSGSISGKGRKELGNNKMNRSAADDDDDADRRTFSFPMAVFSPVSRSHRRPYQSL